MFPPVQFVPPEQAPYEPHEQLLAHVRERVPPPQLAQP